MLYNIFLVVSDSPKMSMSAFLSGLEASNWLKHIKSVMDTSVFIAKVSLFSFTFLLPSSYIVFLFPNCFPTFSLFVHFFCFSSFFLPFSCVC